MAFSGDLQRLSLFETIRLFADIANAKMINTRHRLNKEGVDYVIDNVKKMDSVKERIIRDLSQGDQTATLLIPIPLNIY